MKRRSIILLSAFGAFILATSLVATPIIANRAFAEGKDFDMTAFTPLSHIRGEEVCITPSDIESWFNTDSSDLDTLSTLYEYNIEMAQFDKNFINYSDWVSGSAESRAEKSQKMAALYSKWDGFHQVNNTLKWKSSVASVDHYEVAVSLDDQMTKVVYSSNSVSKDEPSFTMNNLYNHTDYYWQVKAVKSDSSKVKSPIYHFKTTGSIRTVDVEGVSNTRDFGGYTTAYGTIKQGIIYRGGRLDEATSSGLNTIKNVLKIKTDIDLRRTDVGETPKQNVASLTNYVGPVDCCSYGQIDPAYPEIEASRAKLKTVFTALADKNNYPVYFHCTIGRDRTGTIGMILDALLGANKEKILHDYWTSVFAVPSVFEKPILNGYISNVDTVISALEKENKSNLAEDAASMLIKAGVTQEQIDEIRNILTGKTSIPDPVTPIKPEDNYEGQVFATFKCPGYQDDICVIYSGEVPTTSITLPQGYAWFKNGVKADITKQLRESSTFIAKKLTQYEVKIHYVKGEQSDVTLSLSEGEVVNISSYIISGKTLTAILDTGKEISKFTVNRNATINLLYK